MKFYPLASVVEDRAALASEYRAAKPAGKLRLGELRLFCRAGLRTFYIPYRDVRRVFRRVERIAAKKASLGVENLVICGKDDAELIQVRLPGTNAARELMDELRTRIPEARFGKPGPDAQNL